MSGLPALNQEDESLFAKALKDFLSRSKAHRALLLDQAGYIIHQAGRNPELDTDSFAALTSNAFNAIDAIDALSECLQETDFKILHQRGSVHQTGIFRIDESCLLVAVVSADIPFSALEDAAAITVAQIAEHLKRTRDRTPEVSIDIADHDPASVKGFLFNRKPSD